MILVEHRINSVAGLDALDPSRGVEIDVRDYDGELRLTHDPFSTGERLLDFLAHYKHGLLIVNVKCDGLERLILPMLREHGVMDYFFLDCANPTLISLVRSGVQSVAVRFSEYEPLEFAMSFAGRAEWVWVDCFTRMPLDERSYTALKERFKMCLVSPELQGFSRETICEYRRLLATMPLDAVCSDFCEDWL